MKRSSRSFLKGAACLFDVVVLIFIAVVLQGCGIEDARRNAFWRSKDIPRIDGYLGIMNLRVPEHSKPFWRAAREYWDQFGYREPGTNKMKFLSCMDKKVNGLEVCSGQGACMPWDPEDMANPLFFCKCGKRMLGLNVISSANLRHGLGSTLYYLDTLVQICSTWDFLIMAHGSLCTPLVLHALPLPTRSSVFLLLLLGGSGMSCGLVLRQSMPTTTA